MISDSKAQGGCAVVVGGEQEHSVETEWPSQRLCCLLGQLKLTTIHIAGCSLQKPDTCFRTSKNVPLCSLEPASCLGGAYLILGREKTFHICTQLLYGARLHPAHSLRTCRRRQLVERRGPQARSPCWEMWRALQLFQLLSPRPGFLWSPMCPHSGLLPHLSDWFCLFL